MQQGSWNIALYHLEEPSQASLSTCNSGCLRSTADAKAIHVDNAMILSMVEILHAQYTLYYHSSWGLGIEGHAGFTSSTVVLQEPLEVYVPRPRCTESRTRLQSLKPGQSPGVSCSPLHGIRASLDPCSEVSVLKSTAKKVTTVVILPTTPLVSTQVPKCNPHHRHQHVYGYKYTHGNR